RWSRRAAPPCARRSTTMASGRTPSRRGAPSPGWVGFAASTAVSSWRCAPPSAAPPGSRFPWRPWPARARGASRGVPSARRGWLFGAGRPVGGGVKAVAEDARARRNWDVAVQWAGPASVEEIATLVARVPHVRLVEGWTIAKVGVAGPGRIPLTRTYPDQGHGGVSLTAVPAPTTTFAPPKLLQGRWLHAGETDAGATCAVVVNQSARDKDGPDVQAGDTVQLVDAGKPTTWLVVGSVEERQGGGGGAYATAEGFADALGQPRRANQLRIATEGHDE